MLICLIDHFCTLGQFSLTTAPLLAREMLLCARLSPRMCIGRPFVLAPNPALQLWLYASNYVSHGDNVSRVTQASVKLIYHASDIYNNNLVLLQRKSFSYQKISGPQDRTQAYSSTTRPETFCLSYTHYESNHSTLRLVTTKVHPSFILHMPKASSSAPLGYYYNTLPTASQDDFFFNQYPHQSFQSTSKYTDNHRVSLKAKNQNHHQD